MRVIQGPTNHRPEELTASVAVLVHSHLSLLLLPALSALLEPSRMVTGALPAHFARQVHSLQPPAPTTAHLAVLVQ